VEPKAGPGQGPARADEGQAVEEAREHL
jgi:hypothetical protein